MNFPKKTNLQKTKEHQRAAGTSRAEAPVTDNAAKEWIFSAQAMEKIKFKLCH